MGHCSSRWPASVFLRASLRKYLSYLITRIARPASDSPSRPCRDGNDTSKARAFDEGVAVTVRLTEGRMFAALSATNEAILRTDAPEELFQRVCDAAVHGGGFKAAGALLPQSDGWLRFAAATGYDDTRPLTDIRISIDPNCERGQGLAGPAFRTARSCISNDFQNDERFRPWRKENRGEGIGAAAAVPILKDGRSIGVFLFFLVEAGSLT